MEGEGPTLNSVKDGGEFKSHYCKIYPEKLKLGKENNKKHEASRLDIGIKIRDGKFQVGLKASFFFLLSECQTIQAMYHLA